MDYNGGSCENSVKEKGGNEFAASTEDTNDGLEISVTL